MGYQTVATALVNTDHNAQQYEFSRRKIILAVTCEYIRYELSVLDWQPSKGIDGPFCDKLESELRIRNVLKSKDIVKSYWVDFVRDCLLIYVINPDYDLVPEAVNAPEITVTL